MNLSFIPCNSFTLLLIGRLIKLLGTITSSLSVTLPQYIWKIYRRSKHIVSDVQQASTRHQVERQCRNDRCAANWLNVKQRLDRKQWNISVHVDIDSQVGHVVGTGSNWEKNESNWSKHQACVRASARSGSSVTQESTHLLPRLNCVVICNSTFTGAELAFASFL